MCWNLDQSFKCYISAFFYKPKLREMRFFCQADDVHVKDVAGSELPLALGSLWDLTCRFCIDSVLLVLVVLRGVSSIGLCLVLPTPFQPNAALKEGPPSKEPQLATSLLRFYSCGPGVISVWVTKRSKLGPIKTQDQRNKRQSWTHLLRLVLQQKCVNCWCLSPQPPPCMLGPVVPLLQSVILKFRLIFIYV